MLILPGIMGSKLGFPGMGPFDDAIWVDPIDIAAGRLGLLALGASGEAGPVRALGVMLFAYLVLKLRLRIAGHDAEFAPFDWRLGLDRSGAELARRINEEPDRDTHLVAHSMGGLVARAALRHGPKRLGRVVTLGTPHWGSYSPVQAFRGVHFIVQKVAFLDLSRDQAQLAEIFGAFPGLLEMIPSPKLRPDELFRPESWPKEGACPQPAMLEAAAVAQAALPEPKDFLLIVGAGNETVVHARLNEARTEFVYDLSPDGDGTVPLDLARVPGRPAWVTEAGHGSMPNSKAVAQAVDNLLATGTTRELETLEERLGATARRSAITRSVTDRELGLRGGPEGRRGRQLAAREQRSLIEEFAAPPEADPALAASPSTASSLLPVGAAAGPLEQTALVSNFVVTRRQRQRLDIDLVHGSITEVRADAYVLGVFRNVAPGGAASAVNQELGGALDQLIARRMVAGEAGEITAFPTGRHRLGAGAVMLAGLGSIATYSDTLLELVGENVMRTALLSRLDDFAVVPIGGGSGSDPAVALELLLRGFLRALSAVPDGRLRGFSICELDPNRFRDMQAAFHRLLRTSMFGEVEITLNERRLPEPVAARGATVGREGPQAVYLLVRQEVADTGQATAIASVLTAGGKAAIVKGQKPLDDAKVDRLARDLARRGLPAERTERFGAELAEEILPADIRDVLRRELRGEGGSRGQRLVVVHDGPMSRVPWETLHIDGAAPALDGGVTHRYDGGVLSVAKWSEERANTPGLNVLLVVNPTHEIPGLDLPGAELEGERVRALLDRAPGVRIRRLHGNEARRTELLRCFQSGEFDVVHYAGHAFFDPEHRARSGILCAGREILSGADLASLSRLPSLVFFNACEAARVRQVGGAEAATAEVARGTVSFAESFLAGGVVNYLGTYWPVNDEGAEAFAGAFYAALLRGEPLGPALIAGRQAVRKLNLGDWANYVLYGNPEFILAPATPQ